MGMLQASGVIGIFFGESVRFRKNRASDARVELLIKPKTKPTPEPSKTPTKKLMQVVGTSSSMCESRITVNYDARLVTELQAGDRNFAGAN